MAILPELLPAGSVQLRCWSPSFAEAMLTAVEESLPELEQWMPWAQATPTVEGLHQVLRQGGIDFRADRNWEYAIFDARSGEVVGAAGLHRMEVTDAFEIGYWVRTSRTCRGIATSAVQALVGAASHYLDTARRIVIRMDQANLASAGVARRLGFTLDAQEDRDIAALGHTGHGFVWILDLPGQ
jgi:ribosomal-protein-serine acetyltransferase